MKNKIWVAVLLGCLMVPAVQADMRVDGDWCHYVNPPPNTNADNETKFPTGQCWASIDEDDDGDAATGVSHYTMEYTERSLPFPESTTFVGQGNINCNLVDGNNTYTTTDWSATYTVKRKGNKKDDDDRDNRRSNRVPQPTDPVTVEFNLECFDAAKQ
jgi:hypothetical protein